MAAVVVDKVADPVEAEGVRAVVGVEVKVEAIKEAKAMAIVEVRVGRAVATKEVAVAAMAAVEVGVIFLTIPQATAAVVVGHLAVGHLYTPRTLPTLSAISHEPDL